MSKIDEILKKHTGCEGTCECGCGLIEAMEEFGRQCYQDGIAEGAIRSENGGEGLEFATSFDEYLKEQDNEN
jgi:hypothetical protein